MQGEVSPGTRGWWVQGGSDLLADGPEPGQHLLCCSPAAPGAPLFAHGCEHLADVGSQKIIHFVALEPGVRK